MPRTRMVSRTVFLYTFWLILFYLGILSYWSFPCVSISVWVVGLFETDRQKDRLTDPPSIGVGKTGRIWERLGRAKA